MATKEVITKVWIIDGCIVCDACENAAPDVFEVLEDTCIVRPDALKPDFTKPRSENIVDAAEECPVDVIKFETQSVEISDEEVAAAAATVEASSKDESSQAVPEKSPEAPAPKSAEAATASVVETPKEEEGASDPAISALLKAATTRGGSIGIAHRTESVPESVDELRRKKPDELPPDARQAKVMEAAKKVKNAPDKSRRAFAGSAALAVGWTAFGAGTAISVGPAFGRFMMPNVLEEPDPRIRVGKLQPYIEMQPGEVNEDYKPQGIWMIREEGRIAALNIICTHLGCIPNWLPNDRKFKCPCHGSGYKANGINFEGPTPRPLERFRLTIEDGILVVDKSKKYQYELGQWDQPGSYIEV